MLLCKQYVSFCVLCAFMMIGYSYSFLYYEKKTLAIMIIGSMLGFFSILYVPVSWEHKIFHEGKFYIVEGEVQSVHESQYYQWVVLKNVSIPQDGTTKLVKGNIQLKLPLEPKVTVFDHLIVNGKCDKQPKQMNPSDFDTEIYLKSQEIIATFKGNIVTHKVYTPMSEHFTHEILYRIEENYSLPYRGILSACLLGNDEALQDTTKTLYNQTGIGHVLSISGFHVNLIIAALLVLLCRLPISYNWRHYSIIIGIWCYAYLTGGSVSTIRASCMASVLLLGHALWQEEDEYTMIAIAALIILLRQPYQLFMAGFQLSFGAVTGILFILNSFKQAERQGKIYLKWQKTVAVTVSVSLVTWPILAYHFYEIPFLISVLNLFVIPLFTIVILGGWVSILVFPISFLSKSISLGIECILWGIEFISAKGLKLPLATLCIGRPSWLSYAIYGLCCMVLWSKVFLPIKSNKAYKLMGFCGLCYISMLTFKKGPLTITSLYVGQGDATVIETPHHQMLVIDGGNKGQGKTVMNYMKYCGQRYITAMFLSHSDADHISGLIEMLELGVPVGQVYFSAGDDSEALEALKACCEIRNIPIRPLQAGDRLIVDDVSLTALAPTLKTSYASLNDCSLVQLLRYETFKALFTGDISEDVSPEIYDQAGAVHLLKVSHHGSKTGTDDTLLLKLRPSYAMISCGINNSYGHPHQEVIHLLDQYQVNLMRTDKMGALCYQTDGAFITQNSFREEDP